MEAHRKNCFEQLRHKNACTIDELKSRLRKVIDCCLFLLSIRLVPTARFMAFTSQLYVQDIKSKRERVLKDKRDILVSDEDDVDFFTKYCREFFGRNEDPGDVDEDLLLHIWEEIKLEGTHLSFCSY